MELILWRHAEAEPGDIDELRPLTPKGARCVHAAQALGRRFATVDALGTASTAEHILAACGCPHARHPVLAVGHQPLLGQVAALIFSGAAHDWKIRKASVFWIASKGDDDPAPFVRLAVGPDLVGKLR